MPDYVIYDGNCNLCTTLVHFLASLDQGQQFRYVTMQDAATLAQWGITASDCEAGMILLSAANPAQRWQGSAAAEEIGRQLPLGEQFVAAYRALPGLKGLGDRAYVFIRDHRYSLFGRRATTDQAPFPVCDSDHCQL